MDSMGMMPNFGAPSQTPRTEAPCPPPSQPVSNSDACCSKPAEPCKPAPSSNTPSPSSSPSTRSFRGPKSPRAARNMDRDAIRRGQVNW